MYLREGILLGFGPVPTSLSFPLGLIARFPPPLAFMKHHPNNSQKLFFQISSALDEATSRTWDMVRKTFLRYQLTQNLIETRTIF